MPAHLLTTDSVQSRTLHYPLHSNIDVFVRSKTYFQIDVLRILSVSPRMIFSSETRRLISKVVAAHPHPNAVEAHLADAVNMQERAAFRDRNVMH